MYNLIKGLIRKTLVETSFKAQHKLLLAKEVQERNYPDGFNELVITRVVNNNVITRNGAAVLNSTNDKEFNNSLYKIFLDETMQDVDRIFRNKIWDQ